MSFADRLFNYLESNRKEKKAERERMNKEREKRDDWYLVHTGTSCWLYKTVDVSYEYDIYYLFMENAVGERKLETYVNSPNNEKHKDTYLRDNFYILKARPWQCGARNILDIPTYEDARRRHLADLLKK